MGRVKLCFCIVFSLYTISIIGQNIFQGKLTDVHKQPIISASVLLIDSQEKIIAYTFSDESGMYKLSTDRIGKFVLSVSSMGFEKKELALESSTPNNTTKLDIELASTLIALQEVVIKSTRPITIDGDKVIFDVQAFTQGNEEVVEDVLKKLPGISVSSDGTITVGDQEVEKVMINNDDMFEKGYKILTKNMPADPIDKVEVLQNYSSNKHLKGIEDSKKVALNLQLKKEYENIWFGNLQLAYGLNTANRYEARVNLMNFGNKSKLYFITNLNNTGYDAVGDISHLIRSSKQDEIGYNQSAYTLLNWGEDLPNLKKRRLNFNNAEMQSLNSIFTLSDKVKLKLLGFLNTDENNFYRDSYRAYSVGNTSFENTEEYKGRKKQFTGFGKMDLIYEITTDKTLEYTGRFNNTEIKNTSDLAFNKELLKERLQTDNQLVDNIISFTNKFKQNKVWMLTGRHINEETPQTYSVNQFIFSEAFPEKAKNTAQFSKNTMQYTGIESQVMDKKQNGDLLDIKFGASLRTDRLNSIFQLKEEDKVLSEPVDYQNHLKYESHNLYLTIKYALKLNELKLSTKVGLHQLFNKLQNESQTPFFINPSIGIDWRINKKNKIFASYSLNTTNAKIIDVYTNNIQTGFRSFSKGTNDFSQLKASSFNVNYKLGNIGDNYLANIFLSYLKNHDFFSTNSYISQNFTQSEKIIIKNRDFLAITSSLDRYLTPIHSNLKLSLGLSQITFKNIVNNSNLREVKNNNYTYGLELRSSYRGIFNYHIGSSWNYVEVKTTISNSYTNNLSFLDLDFRINEKFNIKTQTERYLFGNLDKSNNTYYFMDLNARYVIKQNKLTVSLIGNNLFDTKTFNNYSISDVSISKTEYRLLPRHILLKMEYRF